MRETSRDQKELQRIREDASGHPYLYESVAPGDVSWLLDYIDRNQIRPTDEMRTFWFCEECREVGVITHQHHAGVYEVRMALRKDHDAASPECQSPDVGVLVFRDLLMGVVPEWAIEPLSEAIES